MGAARKPGTPDALGKGFAALYDSPRLGMATLEPGGRFIGANAALQAFLGYTEEELRARTFDDVTYPDDVPACRALFKSLQEGAIAHFELEKRYVRKDRAVVWAHVVVAAVRDGGRLTHTVGVAEDITERKRAESELERRVRERTEELEYQGALLRAEQEASPDGILVVDERRRIVVYNRRFVEMWDIPPEVVASRSDDAAIRSVLDKLADPKAFLDRVESLYASPETTVSDEIHLKDGRVFERYSRPIFESDRAFRGRVWYFHDVTGRAEAERAVRLKSEELARSNADLEMFAYASAHDLSAPLRKIADFAGRLRAREGDEEARRLADDIGRCAEGMSGLIADVLTLSQIGREAAPAAPVALDAVFAAAVSDLEVPIREAGARVTAGPLPTVRVQEGHLRRLLLNLIGNALKFRRPEEPLRVTVTSARGGDGGVELSVADNGTGFDPRYAKMILEPFRRLHPAETHPGSGIGLALCDRIARLYGGRLEAEGVPGRGATFRLRLPPSVLAALLLACGLAGASERVPLQDVVVKPGDTLWSIANRYLDDPSRWDELLAHNRLPSKDPTVALPGMTLRVPTRLIKAALRAAHLTYFVNDVRFRRSETAAWKGVKVGQELRRGDGLRTLADSRARVMLLDKELLNLEADSMAIIKPDAESDLVLRRGGVFAGKARVVTSSARVTPRSGETRYFASVEADLTTRVQVMRGTATVDAQGVSLDVPAGMETAVPPGMKPGRLRPVRDLPLLEARAQEHLSALQAGGGIAADPRPEPPAPEPEGDAESVRGDIQVLKIGQPIKAYHVQASATVDFRKPLFDRYYDEGDRFIAAETGLAPGNYWWRVAAVDLLGIEGPFRAARYYSLGVKRADPNEERMASSLDILTPQNNDQIGGDVARASGILRDQRLTLHVNGVPVKVNEDGTFAITVRVRYGRTAIVFTLSDPKGNQAHVSRYVMKL